MIIALCLMGLTPMALFTFYAALDYWARRHNDDSIWYDR